MISDLTVAYMIMVLLTFVGSAIFSRTFCSLTARYPVKQYTDSCLSNCILGGVILECSMLRGKRIPALELMKLIAIAFIIFSSALPYGESFGGGTVFIDLKQTDFSFEHILLTWMRYCGQIGDTLFIAVSAWFLSGSLKCKANKVIHIIFDTWMISFIGLLIASFFLDMSIPDVLHALFPIKYNVNWFVGCYLLYYLIHPMLNKAVNGFGKREFLVLTSALFIMYSVVSTIEKSYYYTNLVGFISLHYFILYYKKYIYQRKINIHAPLILVCASVGIFCWICLLNVLGEYLPPLSDNNLFGCVFMNPLIVFIGIALLDIQTHCKKCNLSRIARITKCSLIVYLIHANHFWLSYGKYFLYEKLNKLGMNILESVFIMVLLYFVGAFVIAFVYDKIFGKIAAWVADNGAAVVNKVMDKLGD